MDRIKRSKEEIRGIPDHVAELPRCKEDSIQPVRTKNLCEEGRLAGFHGRALHHFQIAGFYDEQGFHEAANGSRHLFKESRYKNLVLPPRRQQDTPKPSGHQPWQHVHQTKEQRAHGY